PAPTSRPFRDSHRPTRRPPGAIRLRPRTPNPHEEPNMAAEVPTTVGPHRDRKWVGKSINRLEDPKFLRGTAKYVDDLVFPGMLHVAVLRSPYAHARILSIDTEAAKRLPGVHAVVTGAEAAEIIDPLPDGGPAPDKHV